MSAAWQFAGSLAAVAVMVALAWRFGFSGSPRLEGESEALAIGHSLHGGFDAVGVALDRNGHAALLRDSAGRVALIRPHGAHFVARLLDGTARANAEGDLLGITFTGLSHRLEIGAPEAADWAMAIDRLG